MTGISSMPEKLFKVIVIGDPTVGKTSFVQRYVQNTYRKDYKGTVGVDFALKIIKLPDAQTVKLQLWDIAGGSRSRRRQWRIKVVRTPRPGGGTGALPRKFVIN